MEKIKIGQSYGKIMVLSVNGDKKYKRYNCQCECGNPTVCTGQEILEYQNRGCPDCGAATRKVKRLEDARRSIGLRSGELEVISVVGLRNYSGRNTVFVHCRCDCGNEIDIPLARIKANQAKTCGHDRMKNLENGRTVAKNELMHGTRISSIKTGRKTNRNSITGHTGVSYVPKYGKYRAYINFQRKHYHLGLFENIVDAIQAREDAEKHIYGDFLKWHEENDLKCNK